MQDRVKPFRAVSSAALPLFWREGLKFDVVYVDGAHDIHAVFEDVSNSLRLLSGKGLVCGDDFSSFAVRDGLMLAALASPTPLEFYVMKNDFVILGQSNREYGQALTAMGYERWRALSMNNFDAKRNLRRLLSGGRQLCSRIMNRGIFSQS